MNYIIIGGSGAIALLIGPAAPITIEPIRVSHFENVHDFFKPDNSIYKL